MTPPQLHAGQTLGPWNLVKRIGRGGNGEVWLSVDANGQEAALKILTKVKAVAYQRFRDETATLLQCSDVPAIMPMLGTHLPDDFQTQRAWYAMPIGLPIVEALQQASLPEIVRAVLRIADAMTVMHDRSITHRDVKPANFVLIGGEAYLGDFGLVDFPGKDDLTGRDEDLGPRWTMAPEVRRRGADNDGRFADVYSLAKSLWILLTKEHQGFEGVYVPYGTSGLRNYRDNGDFIGPLDGLLSAATEHKPSQRPTMRQFSDALKEWLRLDGLFHEQNRIEWTELLTRLFSVRPPLRATWTSIEDIAVVLSLLGERSNVNHMFYPTGGGMDLESAVLSVIEPGCLEVQAGGIDLFRPVSLTFEGFPNAIHCSYFRLELGPLKPSGVYETSEGSRFEEVCRLGDSGEYVMRSHYDAGEYGGEPLPKGSDVVSRFLGGSLVITSKASPYNRMKGKYDAYSAIHDKMTAEKLREYVEMLADAAARLEADESELDAAE